MNKQKRDADIEWQDMPTENIIVADLTELFIPVFLKFANNCKWDIYIGINECRIGFKVKTYDEWDTFFENNEYIKTKPDTPEYRLIQSAYYNAKEARDYYMEKYPQWGNSVKKAKEKMKK